ncbi:hypothetical protein R1sor_001680 [Riccia sorocarpa]|uniref:Uncharacterized protein n=1 Tax=Riccia sorocarpa TaxID=122646 RepID=A0ABD3GWM4_9MARC
MKFFKKWLCDLRVGGVDSFLKRADLNPKPENLRSEVELNLAKMAKREISLTLEQQQLDWLQSMATKYGLPTPDKALRIVILFAKQVKDSVSSSFKELSSKSTADKSPVTRMHAIDEVHDTFLEEFKNRYNLSSKDQAVHVILEYCVTNADEKTLFEVKRCRHGETCKSC